MAFTGALEEAGIQISMGGRGRWMDNVFIERLWRSLKYEDIYLKGYADGREARLGIAAWIAFYNNQRPHQALGYATPMAVWCDGVVDASPPRLWTRWTTLCVAHMPIAATTTAADSISCCMISGDRNGRISN